MEKKRTTTAIKCLISQGPNNSNQVEVHCGAFAKDYKNEIVSDSNGCHKHRTLRTTGQAPHRVCYSEKESVCLGTENHNYRLAGALNQVKLEARMRLTIV